MIAVKAHYDGKVIVPDEPVDLPKGQKLLIRFELVKTAKQSKKKPTKGNKPGKKRKKISVLDWLEKNAVVDDNLPTDLAHQHDHYLYGTPKKPDLKL